MNTQRPDLLVRPFVVEIQTNPALTRRDATFMSEGAVAAAETRGFPMQTKFVRSGLITAQMEVTDLGVIFHAPLCFDEEVVAETGSWTHLIDASDEGAVADALTDTYDKAYDDWCARKAAACKPTRVKAPRASLHTPCPALWAGR
jgi:hypothetical protein